MVTSTLSFLSLNVPAWIHDQERIVGLHISLSTVNAHSSELCADFESQFALAARQLLVWLCSCTCAAMGWGLRCRLSCVVWLLIKLLPKQPLFSLLPAFLLENSPGLLLSLTWFMFEWLS